MWFFFWTGEGVYWHCYQTTDTCFLSQRPNCNLSLYIYQYSSIFSCLVRDNGHLESFTKSGILALRVAYHWGGVKADLFFFRLRTVFQNKILSFNTTFLTRLEIFIFTFTKTPWFQMKKTRDTWRENFWIQNSGKLLSLFM